MISRTSVQFLIRLYIGALVAIALVMAAGQFVVQRVLDQRESDSRIVNIAGRQRMLSQELAKSAVEFEFAENPAVARARIQETHKVADQLESSQRALQTGDPVIGLPGKNSPEIQHLFRQIQPSFDVMLSAARRLELISSMNGGRGSREIRSLVDLIMSSEQSFLRGMDDIAFRYDKEARVRVSHLKRLHVFLLALRILILAFEVFFIFIPGARKIQESIDELVKTEELRLAKEAAEETTRAKNRFLANVSHEIRTPITALLSMSELLKDTRLDPSQKELAEAIFSSADGLSFVINDLLELSILEAGRLTVNVTPFNLHETVSIVHQMFASQAKAMALDFSTVIHHTVPPMVYGDPIRLKQILINFVSNAVKFTQKGFIRIEATLDEWNSPDWANIRFSVCDSGLGIPPELHHLLFQPFAQIGNSSTRQFHGTGLGLAISKHLAELLGGSIGLKSVPNSGSTFWCRVPFRISRNQSQPAGRPDNIRNFETVLAPGRILIVEDNPVNRKAMGLQLQKLGHAFDAVSSAEEAITSLDRMDYRLILLDCQMPKVDGYDLAGIIRKRADAKRNTPIIAVTAHAMEWERERCLAAGMDDCLLKPLRLGDLQSAVSRWQSPRNTQVTEALCQMPDIDPAALKKDLLRDFIECAPKDIQALRAHMAQGTMDIIRKTAHHLRGSCMYVGAEKMGDYCVQVIAATKEGRSENLAGLVEAIDREFDRIRNDYEKNRCIKDSFDLLA